MAVSQTNASSIVSLFTLQQPLLRFFCSADQILHYCMDTMAMDSPTEPFPSPSVPRDRVLKRLAELGATEEYLQRGYPGFVDFSMDSQIHTFELVSAILPLDEEVAEVLGASNSESTMKHYFEECMVWIQWLMFSGDPAAALKNLSKCSAGHGLCGLVWEADDIAYRCQTCEQDPLSALCVSCFENGNHRDHDYSVTYVSRGCCDCGDVTAWKGEAFCTKHRGIEQTQPLPEDYADSVGPVLDSLFLFWKRKLESLDSISLNDSTSRGCLYVTNELISVVVEMLLELCECSGSFLSFISRKVVAVGGLLDAFAVAEKYLREPVTKKLHELLLKLTGEPVLQYEFSKVLVRYYTLVIHHMVRNDSKEPLDKYPSLCLFSARIFTVPAIASRLVMEMKLLPALFVCLAEVFYHLAGEDGHLQVTGSHPLYETSVYIVNHIDLLMSHHGVVTYVKSDRKDILRTWMGILLFLQGMCPVERESEDQHDTMIWPYVLGDIVGDIHSLLVDGAFSKDMEEEDNMRRKKARKLSHKTVSSASPIAEAISGTSHLTIPSAVKRLLNECLRAIDSWIRAVSTGDPTSVLARNTVYDIGNKSDGFQILSSPNWGDVCHNVSPHIPLHRLLALVLQRAFQRCYGENLSSLGAVNNDFFGLLLSGCHPNGFASYVMEHPLQNRVLYAEVHAGMWKRNAATAGTFLAWFHLADWSTQGLDLDLFLLQCCAALAPPDLFVNRIMQRFGLLDYVALKPAKSSEYESFLVQEMLRLIIQVVQERRFSGLSPAENLKRQLVHKLAVGDATRSKLMDSLPHDLSKHDHFEEILDIVATYSKPYGINQGKYSMRSTHWKDLDLYHPRLDSRDLQAAEERYERYCHVPAFTAQLPKWTEIYPPLESAARIATCEVVAKVIRAILFYAVFSDKLAEARAPDDVIIKALHLLSLGLDICSKSIKPASSIPLLDFACEEIFDGIDYGAGGQSLLSLLVSLMRMRNRSTEGASDMCPLIESLLKRFADIDERCKAKLQELEPAIVVDTHRGGLHSEVSASNDEKSKAKAQAKRASILEKMKADQSMFLLSLGSAVDDDSEGGPDENDSKNDQGSGDCGKYLCSLCHDPKAKNPVSFLILLQKSRLLSLVERGYQSWDFIEFFSAKLVQNAVNEFADYVYTEEMSDFIEFLRAKFPSLRNTQVPSPRKEGENRTISSFEELEQDVFVSSRKEIFDAEGSKSQSGADSALLGKYIAAISRGMKERSSSSQKYTSQTAASGGFGPDGCDGVYLSSCGHAVHQECLDRYLLSFRERRNEGGYIVDAEKGEFLCPVCRRLANSVLPSLPGGICKIQEESVVPNDGGLLLKLALSLLRSTANLVGKQDFWKAYPQKTHEKTDRYLDSISSVLLKMYFPNKVDALMKSSRENSCIYLWDTLKYTLVSVEIAARSDGAQMAPKYGLSGLYKELKSSSGFVLPLLLNIAQTLRCNNSLSVLQRFRGIQLFSESICSGVSLQLKGDMQSLLKHVEKDVPDPDLRLWNLASAPVLANDAFSSLMWVIFCLPHPFLSSEESLLSLMHLFYIVSVAQSILSYCWLHQKDAEESEFGSPNCLIGQIRKVVGEYEWVGPYFLSDHVRSHYGVKDEIRRRSFPYLRRCALLLKILNSYGSEPFGSMNVELDDSSVCIEADMGVELCEVERLLKIPPLDVVLKDQDVQSTVTRWLNHFLKEYEHLRFQPALRSMHVPFKLLQLPHLFQDLLQRYVRPRCGDCNSVIEDPALCLLCGQICPPRQKPDSSCISCQKENTCGAHAMGCGAGIGVFLSIKQTNILLHRGAHQVTWPSPYLDAFGEEDIRLRRGKPLYLNEERYAALTYMVASHGLGQNSNVVEQSTINNDIVV